MAEFDARDSEKQSIPDQRSIFSRYHTVKNIINDQRDEIAGVDCATFNSIIGKVESIHEHVRTPREQVADAEAFLEITKILALNVKTTCNEGINPSNFVTSLLRHANVENPRGSVCWFDIGCLTSNIFNKAVGCRTMVGPMHSQLKPRKAVVRRKLSRVAQSERPEELDSTEVGKSDTDRNMATMFNILKKKRTVKLEHLVLNRNSFAQTVENIFALSFLVKDGRVKIDVDDNNCHLISPRNAPGSDEVTKKEVSYFHFVFRFDFQDWKLMKDTVRVGEELMPHRGNTNNPMEPQRGVDIPEAIIKMPAPIKTYSRNRGLVVLKEMKFEDLDDIDPKKARL